MLDLPVQGLSLIHICYGYTEFTADATGKVRAGENTLRVTVEDVYKRQSVSWPRVMSGPDTVNPKGLAFYSDLVDELKAAGIEPMVTIFHWNLPMCCLLYTSRCV